MEISELKDRIIAKFHGTASELQEVFHLIDEDNAVYPFNEFELMTMTLLHREWLTYEEYQDIRTEYISKNPNLWIFEISAPRGFGERFAQTFILNKSSKIRPASKSLDKNYHGQYDLWLEGVRIEVKASRVVNADSDAPLYKKALSLHTRCPFKMNFQQLKPQCCDVFIWMAVYRDAISIWIMNSSEVENHPDYSKGQHRGNSGNEGQLHISNQNIETLNQYLLRTDDIVAAIHAAASRQN